MFGAGVYTGDSLQSIKNGQNNTKGQFYGKKHGSGNASISIFHIENLYGFVWKRINGFINNKGKYLLKMTPGNIDGSDADDYNFEGNGYIDVELNCPTVTNSPIKEMALLLGKGMLPKTTSGGSASTYYCDSYWGANIVSFARWGGGTGGMGVAPGVFALSLDGEATTATWYTIVSLAFK